MLRTLSSLVLLTILLSTCDCMNLNLQWNRVGDSSTYVPRLEGIDLPTAELNASTDVATMEHTDMNAFHLALLKIKNKNNPVDVSDLDLGDSMQFETMKVSKIKDMIKSLNATCMACSEKYHYIAAVKETIHDLSIRSVKNILAERGLRCTDCKTHADLARAALQVIRMPPKQTSLPIFQLNNAFLAPNTKFVVIAEEASHILFFQQIIYADSRFAMLPGEDGVGCTARVLHHEYLGNGNLLVKVMGETRFRLNLKHAVGDSGFQMGDITYFTDYPVRTSEMNELSWMAKRVRRAFFAQDTDTAADSRANSLGNPPPESKGAEVLSHWIAHGLRPESRHLKYLHDTRNTHERLRVEGLLLGVDLGQSKLPGGGYKLGKSVSGEKKGVSSKGQMEKQGIEPRKGMGASRKVGSQ